MNNKGISALMKKVCTTCGVEKDINDYWVDNKAADGRYNTCKECKKSQQQTRFYRRLSVNIGESLTKKICHGCGIEQDISAFRRSFTQVDGYSAFCFTCRKIRRQRLYCTIERKEKRCIVCGITKDISCFHRNKASIDGRQGACKSCTSIRSRKGYQDTLARFQAFKQTLKCVRCGESYYKCLSFHHRTPEEKDFNVSAYFHNASNWQAILDEVAKCDVLCENCHRKLHYPTPSHNTNMWKWGIKEGKSCQVCGEDHHSVLDFHHRNPAEKLFGINKIQRIAGMTKEKAIAEAAKCEVLCRNCHIKLHTKKGDQA